MEHRPIIGADLMPDAPTSYRPLNRRRRLACLMLAMNISCSVATIALSGQVLVLLGKARSGRLMQKQLEDADSAHSLLLLFSFVIAGGSAAAFCAWLYGAMRNLATSRFSPEFSIASFFIPVLNLFVPLLSVADAWRRGGEARLPWFLPAWWAMWVVWLVASPVAGLLRLRGDYERGLRVGMGAEAALIVAAVLGILVVQGLSRRAEAHA